MRAQSRGDGRRARSFAPAGSTTRPLIDRASVEIASTAEFINTTVARRYIAKRSPIQRRPRDLRHGGWTSAVARVPNLAA